RPVLADERRRTTASRWPHLGGISARVALLALVTGLSVRTTQDPRNVAWLGLLAIAGVPALLAPTHKVVGPLARLAEVLLTCLGAGAVAGESAPGFAPGDAPASVLPYLLVPVVSATLYRRRREAAALLLVATATLAIIGFRDGHLSDVGYLV